MQKNTHNVFFILDYNPNKYQVQEIPQIGNKKFNKDY